MTDALKKSMVQQTTTFFNYVLTSGAPISDLVASDYTFVDAGLAKLYGLPAPSGTGMSKVSVAGTTRIGGLLGQSSLLMQYASADKPSAVKRGFWVMNSLLCVDDTPTAASRHGDKCGERGGPRIPGESRHPDRKGASRRASHARSRPATGATAMMDPFGLALENYDAVGQWRTVDSNALNKPIDASGQLDDQDPSTKFTDVRGLVPLLAKDSRVSSCVVQQLLTFALGRKPLPGEVADTASHMAGNSDTLPKAILTVATSKPLRLRAAGSVNGSVVDEVSQRDLTRRSPKAMATLNRFGTRLDNFSRRGFLGGTGAALMIGLPTAGVAAVAKGKGCGGSREPHGCSVSSAGNGLPMDELTPTATGANYAFKQGMGAWGTSYHLAIVRAPAPQDQHHHGPGHRRGQALSGRSWVWDASNFRLHQAFYQWDGEAWHHHRPAHGQ